ncbi:hypothetical protein K474DRAFT_1680925 [Panus rudis PR-1116 ss-1]|nr:hypothetical protein K474DRAFT_1680925 [Panus rudis PR-1116 ss-1]
MSEPPLFFAVVYIAVLYIAVLYIAVLYIAVLYIAVLYNCTQRDKILISQKNKETVDYKVQTSTSISGVPSRPLLYLDMGEPSSISTHFSAQLFNGRQATQGTLWPLDDRTFHSRDDMATRIWNHTAEAHKEMIGDCSLKAGDDGPAVLGDAEVLMDAFLSLHFKRSLEIAQSNHAKEGVRLQQLAAILVSHLDSFIANKVDNDMAKSPSLQCPIFKGTFNGDSGSTARDWINVLTNSGPITQHVKVFTEYSQDDDAPFCVVWHLRTVQTAI